MPNPTDSPEGDKSPRAAGPEFDTQFNARWGLSISSFLTPDAPGTRPAETYMDEGVHAILDPVVGIFDSSGRASDELVGYTKGFIKTVPLFMKGRVAGGALAFGYAADEAKSTDALGFQLLDAGLGATKAVLMKKSLAVCHQQGFTPGTTGLTLGFVNRASSVGLTRESYIDSTGQPSLAHGLNRTALAAFNPLSIAVDAASYGAADILWGRIVSRTRGTAVFNPSIGNTLSAGTMGVTSGFGNELHRQLTVDGVVDPLKLARHALLQGTVDGLAGGIGGLQAKRFMRLPGVDSPTAMAEARATPFQRGEIADVHQAKLRDGTFVFRGKVTGLTTETWFGTVQHGGEQIPAIFRPNNGTEAYAHRMQSEIAAYGLSTLGFKNDVPVTVARVVERNGTQHPGFIQEMKGINLADFMKSPNGEVQRPAAMLAQFRNNARLQDAFMRTFVHRMILGEWDNHAKNLSVSMEGGVPKIAQFDLQDALRPATSTLDLTPRPGLRYGWEATNYHLYNEIAGKAMPVDLRADLTCLHQTYNGTAGRLQMQSVGLTPLQVEGVLGKTAWFSTNGTLPREQETYFYKEHFGKTIKPILKRILKGSPAPVQEAADAVGH